MTAAGLEIGELEAFGSGESVEARRLAALPCSLLLPAGLSEPLSTAAQVRALGTSRLHAARVIASSGETRGVYELTCDAETLLAAAARLEAGDPESPELVRQLNERPAVEPTPREAAELAAAFTEALYRYPHALEACDVAPLRDLLHGLLAAIERQDASS